MYKWGIIGTGMIAHKMAEALQLLENAEVSAVLSRKEETAEKFAAKFRIANTFTSLQDFAGSDQVDIVYVATPHNNHRNEAVECMKKGKAVLCEKPMGVNLNEVEAMIGQAKKSNVLLVEAFWTYYFPAMQKALSLIREGHIGKPLMVDARFCFNTAHNPEDRKFNPNLAGGALLDIGLYCISFAQKVFNEFPESITGSAAIGPTGTDDSSAYILKYSDNRLATLSSSFQVETHNDAWVFGEKGKIQIPLFWQPDECIVYTKGNEEKIHFERFGNGYAYEARQFMRYLDEGKKESELFSLNQSIDLVKILDELRQQWGLKYPFENN